MSMTVPPVARRPTRGQKVVPALATSENSFWVFGRDAGEAGMARPSTLILGEVRAFPRRGDAHDAVHPLGRLPRQLAGERAQGVAGGGAGIGPGTVASPAA